MWIERVAALPVNRPDVEPSDARRAESTLPTIDAVLPSLLHLRTRVLRAQHAMAVAALYHRTDLLRALLATRIPPTETALVNAVVAGNVEAARLLMRRVDVGARLVARLRRLCRDEAMRAVLRRSGCADAHEAP